MERAKQRLGRCAIYTREFSAERPAELTAERLTRRNALPFPWPEPLKARGFD
jgi:hypothetical protein